jgi:hypothetical protein
MLVAASTTAGDDSIGVYRSRVFQSAARRGDLVNLILDLAPLSGDLRPPK